MFRPETVHMGKVVIDAEKCNKCGLCVENCPFRALETDENKIPRQKAVYECFSCYNCRVACPKDAISIVNGYFVESGFFATDPNPLSPRMPLEPKDAEGKPDKWNATERLVLERRSVRNYRDKPVPESLIQRVLEAGRFAPSAGNCQPWKFIVITNKSLINEMNETIKGMMTVIYMMYMNDEMVQNLVPMYEANPNPGTFDPRVMKGGFGAIVHQYGPVFLGAPAVILIAGDKRAIGGPQINIGIAGENMNLVAKSLGLGACWIGFSQFINMIPPLKEKLGLKEPWDVFTAMVLGYPRFKQEGIVPREFRPVTWFKEGSEIAETQS